MKKKRIIGVLLALPVAVIGLTGCNNTRATASECTIVVSKGYFDTEHIKRIVLPQERFNTSNAKGYTVPCGARNFVFTHPGASNGDVKEPVVAKTGPSDDGPGVQVDVELSAQWVVNPNRGADHKSGTLAQFLSFCQKYNCFGTSEDSNAPGSKWRNMLDENFKPAMTRAVQHALLTFKPDIWNNAAKWPEVADAVRNDMFQQLQLSTGIETTNFFCNTGATQTSCQPPLITIEHIDPTDPSLRSTYAEAARQSQLQQLAKEKEKTNKAELEAAKARYGTDAERVLGQLDILNACQNKCVVSLSGNSSVAVSP